MFYYNMYNWRQSGIRDFPMNVSDSHDKLLNSISFDIHPMKTVDTCSINESNTVSCF